ncbi:MAG: nuclear transport factor 2 family protein [bacterium]
MDDGDLLLGQNARFYQAIEELSVSGMDELWLHEDWVRCIHPGWDVLVGWERVRQSFEQIFASTRWLRVIPTAVEVQIIGEVGMVACAENITSTSDGDVGVAVAQATNLFRRTPDGWKLFHHHASPAPVHVTQAFSGTVQ